jgi:hypothetical protein
VGADDVAEISERARVYPVWTWRTLDVDGSSKRSFCQAPANRGLQIQTMSAKGRRRDCAKRFGIQRTPDESRRGKLNAMCESERT